MTENKIKEKPITAYKLAVKYEQRWGAYSQSTTRALQEVYNQKDSNIFCALGGFAAGGSCEGDVIYGAYAAGIFFLGTHFGRKLEDLNNNPEDLKASKKLHQLFLLVTELHRKFLEEYGSIICH